MENRVRILEKVVQAIIDGGAFPANRIGFRLSPNGNYGDTGSDDNHNMFPFIAERMSKFGLAYMHVMDGIEWGYHEKCPVVTVYDLKSKFKGTVISNIGLTKEIAEGMIRSGASDVCAFGRLNISNPDLPYRCEHNLPLEKVAPKETWWCPIGSRGYTDWKASAESKDNYKLYNV
jgi:N-ethylmaleimide reductase